MRGRAGFGSFSAETGPMRCPICHKRVDLSPANLHRPFCSERCRMVDLGRWAGEEYRAPGAAAEDCEHPDDRVKKKTPRH